MHTIQNKWRQVRAWYGILSLRKKVFFWIGIAIGVLIIVSILKGKPSTVQVETVRRQDLARTVLASGKVVSSTDLALSFQKGDIVRSVRVSVGEKVQSGQVLATLDASEESAALTKAKGGLLAAEAAYRKVLEGNSDKEITVAQIAFENARRKLLSSDLVATPESIESADEAPVLSGTYNGTEEGEYRLEFYRSTNEVRYTGLETGVVTRSEFAKPLGTKGLLITFPGSSYSYGSEWTVEIPNKEGANYTANANAYKTAEAELALKKATARQPDVDAALADVLTARGSVEAAEAELAKTVIRAPAPGTVTDVDLKIGEQVQAFAPVITLQDISNLYLEADINESNITHIALGQPVVVTYDALDKSTPYTAHVSSVDPSATVVDGIVNYQIKALITDSTTIKPGMTANLSVQTAFVPSVLVIPSRVIAETAGEKTVQVIVDERKMKTEPRTITTGLRGDGGLVEVTSGLTEDEKIAFVPEK